MALQSIFWDTNGTGDGAAPYTEAQLAEWLRKSFLSDPANEGVVPGVGGEFAVTGASSPVTVAAGFAYVYGFPAWDNSALQLALPTPVIGTTGHRVVLRADWAPQTVRVVLKSSSDGVAAVPALEQAAGTRWEVGLAEVAITTGGAITITDSRQRAHFNTRVKNSMLDPGSVTTEKLADGAITATKLGSGAVTTPKLGDGQVTAPKLASGAVVAQLGYTPWGPTNDGAGSGLDADLLDGIQAAQFWRTDNDGEGSGLDADRVAGVDIAPVRRQGGNGTNWGTPGGSNLSPATVRTQLGVIESTPNTSAGSITLTFPTPFAGTPVVTANSTMNSVGGAALDALVTISNLTASGCALNWRSVTGAAIQRIAIGWVAIGPA